MFNQIVASDSLLINIGTNDLLKQLAKALVEIPHDHHGGFEPQIKAKHRRFRRQNHLTLCARPDGSENPKPAEGKKLISFMER